MPEDPASVVQRQLDAYNAHDVDRLVAVYADDASLYEYPDKLTAQGMLALRARFTERFKDPILKATLLSRTVCGDLVIDHESVRRSLPEGPAGAELIAIYRVARGRIAEARFHGGPVSRINSA